MEGLLVWVVERVAKFPREHKFTVGDRLVETCLDITSHLVEASYRRDKRHDLAAASRGLVRARVLVRLARSMTTKPGLCRMPHIAASAQPRTVVTCTGGSIHLDPDRPWN